MADFIELAVVAMPTVRRKELSQEDRHVPGVYSLQVAKGLSVPAAASAALDAFQSCVQICALDHFDYFVVEPATGHVLDEDPEHEGYSKSHLARDIERIADKLPVIICVNSPAGREVRVAGETLDDALAKAKEIFRVQYGEGPGGCTFERLY